jgi:hypothetical protein
MSRASGHLGRYRTLTGLAPTSIAPAPARRRRDARALRDGQAGTEAAGPLLRLRVYFTRGTLDRRIARGLELDATPASALRAKQLAAAPTRAELAADLRSVVRYSERVESRTPRLSAVMLEPARVRAGRSAILRLAERLEQQAPVSPQGVALTHVLLTDAASPLFDRDSERTVTEASCIAEDALVSGPLAPPPSD